MAKCGYPPCVVQIESGGENPPIFCEAHLAVKCNYPPCEAFVTQPGADLCEEHFRDGQFITWLHQIRHVQQGQMVARAKQEAAIKRQLFGGGNGQDGGLIRGR